MATNKEVYHEGWLIKSPPTKRIWRARWRRRWFTLKQGELPGQFFLEYYADRKCRKLKGTIDLDQCEQVDAGLRLDRQKEKYAHMFDVKTPTRTYYLAADTEEDMRGWVNCICQVCSLQETQTVDDRPYYNIGAINMADAINMAETVVETRAPTRSAAGNGLPAAQQTETDVSNETETTMLNHSVTADAAMEQQQQQQQQQQVHQPQPVQQMPKRTPTAAYNPYGTYQNEEMMGLRSMDYTNRETIICEAKLGVGGSGGAQPAQTNAEAYSNLDVIIERSQSLRGKPGGKTGEASTSSATLLANGGSPLVNHMRTQSLNIEQQHQQQQHHRKKIPENLKLTERSPSSAFDSGPEQPSPALSTSSGPYIPISECYSGSPVTPLNSLDPRFYETPRSHTNIGFNLVNNEQPYSPKRNNVGGQSVGPSSLVTPTGTSGKNVATTPGSSGGIVIPPSSGKSSPSDSESVFTDDEWTANAAGGGGEGGTGASGGGGEGGTKVGNGAAGGTIDRNTRPSDSSIENDAVGWTYVQRFSKVPNTEDKQQQQQQQQQQQPQQQQSQKLQQISGTSANGASTMTVSAGAGPPGAPPRPPKRTSLNLEGIEKSKEFISSDTENVSPAIGPKEASAHIEQFYDIPRSHQHPYTSGSSMHLPDGDLLSPLSHCDLVASSTPNLISEFGGSQCGTLGRPRPHCYTNAAPTKVEGNVFRFDFSEQPDSSAPAINRRLKPRSTLDITKSIESVTLGVKQQQISLGNTTVPVTPVPPPPPSAAAKSPPTVDRTRKPATPKFGTNSMRRKGGPVALNLASNQATESTYGNTQDANISLLSVVSPRGPGKNEDRLQYLDLDHSSSPQKSSPASTNYSGPSSIGGGVYSGTSGSQNLATTSSSAVNDGGPSATGSSGMYGGSSRHHHHHHHRDGESSYGGGTGVTPKPVVQTSRTPYTTVDFVKTDAFNRVRADSELTRAQSRLKDQTS
ncbi:AGAP005826-PA-like protein [Anopheles sinensis]|uniref:AGAP005826-PA-like protein n=1 Tax=Anopheles sinensis TaxID=74873 RepID=A0A084VDA2_ANOSI|nr:AGAP005826-PA-like protein [Anopheles sinensis]